jgi:hypothetical protein
MLCSLYRNTEDEETWVSYTNPRPFSKRDHCSVSKPRKRLSVLILKVGPALSVHKRQFEHAVLTSSP